MKRSFRLLAALAPLVGLLIAPSAPADAAPSVSPSAVCSASAADEAHARVLARRCGVPVEVEAARTAKSQLHAQPDGRMEMTQSLVAQRARRADGSWVTIDTKLLRDATGGWAPAASAEDVRFSGGGHQPLVTWRRDGHVLTLSWPYTLATPAVSGATALYPDALVPGVDLQLTATTEGFSHLLIIRNAQAAANPALTHVRFLLGGDVTVTPGATEGLVLAAGGQTFATSGGAFLWDSADPTTTSVPMTVEGGALVLSPASSALVRPGLVYPLYLDPIFNGGTPTFSYANDDNVNWTVVDNTQQPGEVLHDPQLWAGLDPAYARLYRGFLKFPLGSTVKGQKVLSAWLDATLDHSYDCNNPAQPVYLYQTSQAVSTQGGRVTWAGTIPGAVLLDTKSPTANEQSCARANDSFSFSSTTMSNQLQSAVDNPNTTTYTFAISAGSTAAGSGESTQARWKRFDLSAFVLRISYNSYPETPTAMSTRLPSACVSTTGADIVGLPRLNSNNAGGGMILSAKVHDPDNNNVGAVFEWWPKATRGTSGRMGNPTVAATSPNDSIISTTVPSGTFTEGTAYSWRVAGYDGSLTSKSFGPWCEFVADMTPPGVPTVTADPGNDLDLIPMPGAPPQPRPDAVVGRPTQVTFHPAGGTDTSVVGYVYGFGNSTAPTRWVPADATGTATVTITPVVAAPLINELTVLAVDSAGNRSAIPVSGSSYGFRASPSAGWWPTTGTVLTDATPGGNDLALSGGATLARGALTLDGTTGEATGWAPIDTTSSFTVTAWARVADLASNHAVAGQDGEFQLGYRKTQNAWCFSFGTANACGTPTPAIQTWTHLAAVYNAATQTMTLYENGAVAGTASYTASTPSYGTFAVGRGYAAGAPADRFKGDIADIRAFPRALDQPGIITMAALPPVAAEYRMDDPAALTVRDSSDVAGSHDGTLSGGAGWLTGHTGSGLWLDGTGYATAPGPAIVTNASFTVSVWVRTSTNTVTQTILSQDGSRMSGFTLGSGFTDRTKWSFGLAETDSDGSARPASVSSSPLAIGAWTHLAGRYDATTKQMTLFVNGTAQPTVTLTTGFSASGALVIGRGRYKAGSVDLWNGAVDDIRIYQGLLSQTQISLLAAA